MEGKWECIGFEFPADDEEYPDSVVKVIMDMKISPVRVSIKEAHLISAAPELLEACKDIKTRYAQAVAWMLERESDSDKWPGWMPGCRTAIEDAEAAFAKAKGEA